jgi:hypothetical protein
MVVGVVVAGFFHEEAGAGQAAADGALGLEDDLFGQVERTDSFLQQGQRHA